MANAFRKINRKLQNKKKKILRKSLQEMKKRMNSLGRNCRNCNVPFEGLEKDHSDRWMVYVIDNQPNLMCPACYEKVQEAKREWEEESDD